MFHRVLNTAVTTKTYIELPQKALMSPATKHESVTGFSEDYETWKSKKKIRENISCWKTRIFLVALNISLLSDLLNENVWQIIKLLTIAHTPFPPRTSLKNFLLLLGDSCGWFSQNIALVYKKLVKCILRQNCTKIFCFFTYVSVRIYRKESVNWLIIISWWKW